MKRNKKKNHLTNKKLKSKIKNIEENRSYVREKILGTDTNEIKKQILEFKNKKLESEDNLAEKIRPKILEEPHVEEMKDQIKNAFVEKEIIKKNINKPRKQVKEKSTSKKKNNKKREKPRSKKKQGWLAKILITISLIIISLIVVRLTISTDNITESIVDQI